MYFYLVFNVLQLVEEFKYARSAFFYHAFPAVNTIVYLYTSAAHNRLDN